MLADRLARACRRHGSSPWRRSGAAGPERRETDGKGAVRLRLMPASARRQPNRDPKWAGQPVR